MKLWTLPILAMSVLAATCSVAQQSDARYAIRFGYFVGTHFTEAGTSFKVEGLEVGGDILLKKHLGAGSLYFSPSVTFGHNNAHQGYTKNDICRVMMSYKLPLGTQGLYAGIGAGLGITDVDSSFGSGGGGPELIEPPTSVTGGSLSLILGHLFKSSNQRFTPFVEANWYMGGPTKLQGLSLSAGLRF